MQEGYETDRRRPKWLDNPRAERTQYRPHSLSNHLPEKQFAAVKGSRSGCRANSVCAGPVLAFDWTSMDVSLPGLSRFVVVSMPKRERSSELTPGGNTKVCVVYEEERGCPTGARNVSVERHPQRPQLPDSSTARAGLQARPPTHPNGGRRRSKHTSALHAWARDRLEPQPTAALATGGCISSATNRGSVIS